MLKKMDIVIIISLLVISFLPGVIFSLYLNKEYNMTYAEITVGGKVHSKIPLLGQVGEEIIEVEVDGHINKILIKNGVIEMIDADCPDKYCIKDGEISRVGQHLVCLPNKVMIEIKGDIAEDEIINSY